jgi:diaminopimelate epimerase
MEPMRFVKMHGARNDFVLVDARERAVERASGIARRVCDRRTGIGADGLLVVERSRVAGARMRIVNADGSDAETCGNGIRCVARYLDEDGAGAALAIETDAGVVQTIVVAREPEYLVRVAMGVPRYERIASPENAHFVDVGNPHVVLVAGAPDAVDLERVAASLQGSATLPHGGNVHEMVRGDDAMIVRHYERGVGLTQACGTGAVACAVVALREGFARSPVDVRVPGGLLTVEWDGSGVAHLTGPAVRVFETALDPWTLP